MSCELIASGKVGAALHRPECVLVTDDGDVIVSDGRGGVTTIQANGQCRHRPCPGGTTNGIAQDRDSTLYLAGIDTGTVHALDRDGAAKAVIATFEGRNPGAVNFVHFDPQGGLWVTVSTRTEPRSRAIDAPIPDGYVLKLGPDGPQRKAAGLCFANELRFDPAMRFAYLAESRRGRVVRMPIADNGDLGPIEAFGPDPLFDGAIVDGLAWDVDGGLWVTEVTRNGIYLITPDGAATCLFQDPQGTLLDFPASIAFGGRDRKTVYIGSIRLDHLVTFRSSVAGAPMWHHREHAPNP